MFLTGVLNNYSGIPGANPHLCRVAASLAWFRHQVNKTLIWRLVAARRGGEWADAGHEQRRGVPGAVEGVEGGWRQAQWWGMRGSHCKKVAFSVIFERKSSNIQASLRYSNIFYILRLFSFGMKDWRLPSMTWERSGGWFWNRWALNFVNLRFFCFSKSLFSFPTIIDTITSHTCFLASDDLQRFSLHCCCTWHNHDLKSSV